MGMPSESKTSWKSRIVPNGKSALVFNSTGHNLKPGVGSKSLNFLMRRQAGVNAKRSTEVAFVPNRRQKSSSLTGQPLGDFYHIARSIPVPMTMEDFDFSAFHEFKSPYGNHALEWEMVEELTTTKASGRENCVVLNTPDARRSIRKIASQLDRDTRENVFRATSCLPQELELLVKLYLPTSLMKPLFNYRKS